MKYVDDLELFNYYNELSLGVDLRYHFYERFFQLMNKKVISIPILDENFQIVCIWQ